MKKIVLFLIAASASAQYAPTPRTLTDKENGLILQSCLNNSLATNCNGTGQYGIGFNIQNPNTITQFTQMGSDAIKGWHGVLQHRAAGAEHNASFDRMDELQAYQAAEVLAGRAPLLITSGGNPVYWDNSTFPYGKQPVNVCDSRFVRWEANEHIRRQMLSPSSPGTAQSPQYQNGWQSFDEGFVLGPQTTSGVYGFPGGAGDGSAWDQPFPQTQAAWTACVASFWSQLYAIAPDIYATWNQGSLAEPNGTVNNNDLGLFQQIYGASPNLNIDRETFISQGTSTTATQVLFNIVQNITGWLLTTGRTAVFRGVVDTSAGQIESTALAYLIAKEGNSFFSEAQSSAMVDPNNSTFAWAPVYDQMGNPTSAPSTIACVSGGSDYSNVVFTRTYEGGLVYYNNCTSTQTITLPAGTWYNASGSVVTTLTLLSYAGGNDTLVAQYVTSTNYTSAPIVQQPQISPLDNGTITGSVTATITDGTSGATICYTTDGTTPTASGGTCTHGTTYSTALTISTTTTLTAIASKSGDTNSWERATTFTITATNPSAQFALATDSATPFFTLTYAAITLSNPSASTITVNYTVSGDSNITFSPSSGTAVFAPFQTAVAIPIQASLGATAAIDSITAAIGSGTGYTVGAKSTYTYTIQRDLKPTVTPQYAEINSSACATGRSDSTSNNQNCSAETTLTTGTTSTPATFISAFTWPLTSIPSNATITKATALFYIPTFTDTAADQIPATMSRATTAYTQTTADWANYFGTSSNWSATPTSTTTAIAGNVTGNTSAALTANQNGNHYLLTADVQNIVNGTYANNFGWILQGPTSPAGAEQWNQLTSNSGNAPPSQPSLLVQYSTPASPTITIELPTSSTNYCTVTPGSVVTLAGTICPLNVAIGNAPTAYTVEFWRDASLIAGKVYGEKDGSSRTAPYTYNFNTFNFGNLNTASPHSLLAVLRDPSNNILATSVPTQVSIENFQPQATTPTTDITVTTGEVANMSIGTALTWGMNTISFQGSGTPSIVGSSHFANSQNSPTWTATAGNLIACFTRWQSGTGTMTAADTQGDTPAYGLINANPASGGFSTQWVYFPNIAGGSTHVTVTTTAGSVLLTDCLEINGPAASSPKDIDNIAGLNGPTPQSPLFALGFPANNEIILGGSSWGGSAITATPAPGYTMFQDASKESGVEYIVPTTAGTWFSNVGLSIVTNGPNSGISKTYQINVDGLQVIQNTSATAASETVILNTSQFLNAPHAVVVTVYGGNCSGCTNGTWNIMGQWEQVLTFANPVVPSQLLMTYRDFKLCVTPSTNCPSSLVNSVIVQNTDGSTGTASSYSWVINYSSIGGVFPSSAVPITLSSTTSSSATVAVVAGMQNNATSVTVSAVTTNGTLSRTFWVNIPPDAVGAYTPHFEANGSISTGAYDANSIWFASAFNTYNGFNPYGLVPTSYPGYVTSPITSSINYPALFGPQYAIPFNTQEFSIPLANAAGSTAQTQYQNYATYLAGVALSYQTSYGVSTHLIGTSVFGSTPGYFQTIFGYGSTYSTAPLTYFLNQLASQGVNVRGATAADEVDSQLGGGNVFAGVGTGGIFPYSGSGPNPNGFVSIDCTVSPATLNTTAGVWGGLIGSSTFIIHGSAASDAAAINYNFSSGNAAAYKITSGNTFTRPTGCTTLHDYAHDPTIQIEPIVAWTYDASFVNCTGGGGTISSGPCPNYIKYNSNYLWRQQWLASTNPPALTASVKDGVYGASPCNWGGKCNIGTGAANKFGNFYGFYFNPGNINYLADKIGAPDAITSQGNGLRQMYQWTDLGAPMITETAGTVLDYMAQGYPISVASCVTTGSGATLTTTVTTTLPHGLYNIMPGLSRFPVTGSSGANCDTPSGAGYYALSSPTSTAMTVALANATIGGTATGGTIAFDNGVNWPLSTLTPSTSGNNEGGFSGVNISTCPNTEVGSVQWKSLRGHQFTISGATTTWKIIGATNTSPIVLTLATDSSSPVAAPYGGNSGDSVTVAGVGGNTGANGTFTITYSSSTPTQVTLVGSTGNGTYTSGGTLTVSSGSTEGFNNSSFTGIFMPDVLDACPASGASATSTWRQIPSITSSTGGTAQIIKSHWYTRGDAWPNNSETGAGYMFASNSAPLVWHTSGIREYPGVIEDPQLYDRTLVGLGSPYIAASIGLNLFNVTNFNCNHLACPQAGPNPSVDFAKSLQAWQAITMASLKNQRMIPYAYGYQLPDPDFGQFYEAAAWTSARGNALDIQSFADNPTTLTITTTPYLVSGQAFYSFCSSAESIQAVTTYTAGTNSVTLNFPRDGDCSLIFPVNAAAEMQFPVISARLADVANAASILVQFSYSPTTFKQGSAQSSTLFQTYSLGTGTAQIPFDLGIGQLGNHFYRLLYLNSSGTVIGTGDVQNF